MFHNKFKNQYSTSILRLRFLLFFLLLVCFMRTNFSQWIKNPKENNQLAIETMDPINISAADDENGGAFVFWEDNKYGFQNEVYFMHIDDNGRISFRADGKKITSLNGPEDNPIISSLLSNSAVVVWKDFTDSKSGYLMAQRVNYNGLLLWTNKGIEISNSNHDIYDYSVSTDNLGNTFVAFVDKEPKITGDYKVVLKKISLSGKEIFAENEISLNNSRIKKNLTSVVPDNNGGAYVFWLEVIDEKVILFGQHINSEGKETWERKPIEISNRFHNVLNYSVIRADNSNLYIVWQIQRADRMIYHQLISGNGKPLWQQGGKPVTEIKGSQVNPVAIFSNSSIILSWTNDFNKKKKIILQRFDMRGKPLWGKNGIKATQALGQQFGQHLIGDGKRGTIISWIDSRNDSTYANIYAQEINMKGEQIWNPDGLPVAINYNSPKSYLNLIPSLRGGAIVVFKNRRNGLNKIYAQRILNESSLSARISQLAASVQNDSVKINWNISNEKGLSIYHVERAVDSDTLGLIWKTIYTGRNKEETYKYQYFDSPDTSGTLYYRIELIDSNGNTQPSDIARVDYFGQNSDIMVMQNDPNPFVDSTDISFYLPSPDRVTIEFYDSHVNMVSRVENKLFQSGENHLKFFAQGLKPGIYFYRFRCEDYVEVKKMVITD